MSDLNICIIKGRVGSPIQPREGPGAFMCSFVVGTGERWRDKITGEPKSKTTWLKCIAWGDIGLWCMQYLKKGTEVFLTGKITERKWQGSEGEKKSALEIQVDKIEM